MIYLLDGRIVKPPGEGYDGAAEALVMPNIYEVAKRAGVSTATVSRVLSRPQVVSPETRRRVLQAVKVMAYAPNSAAKNLRTLRTGKLLVTVPDISNPFFSLILQGIEDAAQREGHAVLFGDTQHDEQREERYAMMLQRKEADGLIFLGHRLPKSAGDLVRSMAPACAPVVNGCEFNPRLRIPSVHIDNAAAAARGMDHLLAPGHPPRGHGSSLRAWPSTRRHYHRPAGQPVEPRSPARRDDAGARRERRAGFHHHAR